MRTLVLGCLAILASEWSFPDEFLRPLPERSVVSSVTAERYPAEDAVLLVKEQRCEVALKSILVGRYIYILPMVTETEIVIVKLLKELAVAQYGSPEFEYTPFAGRLDFVEVKARARTLKGDGRVIEMDSDDMHTVVAVRSKDGDPLVLKLILVIPDVAVGDIVQTEYQHTRPSFNASRLFFLSDRYPVLTSSVVVSLPEDLDAYFVSLPDSAVGRPQLFDESSSRKKYTWTVRDLQAVRREPYGPAFRDRAVVTSFIVKRAEDVFGSSEDEWALRMKEFVGWFETLGKVKDEHILSLGFPVSPANPTLQLADSLYTAMRGYFTILEAADDAEFLQWDFDQIFEDRSSFPSSLAYVMYTILEQWKCKPSLLLISDRRTGAYKRSIPTLDWFDRVGVMLEDGGRTIFYDFDPSVPAVNDYPWYFSDSPAIRFDRISYGHWRLPSFGGKNTLNSEQHHLAFSGETGITELTRLLYRRSFAQKKRALWSGLRPETLTETLRTILAERCLRECDSVSVNDFQKERDVTVTGSGLSRIESMIVDTLWTVSLTNHLLWELRNEFLSTDRQSDVVFSEPFELRMDWILDLPPGVSPFDDPVRVSLSGPTGCKATMMSQFDQGKLLFRCRLSIASPLIPRAQYQDFIRFLESVAAETDRTLVFRGRPGQLAPE